MEELQKIVDALSKQLAEFDAQAKKAMQSLAAANAQKQLQEMRMERQSQLAGLSSMQGSSTALNALTRRAQAVSNEAAGMRIVADIGQKPLDQQAELDAIRKSVSQPETAGESALERLKLLGRHSVYTALAAANRSRPYTMASRTGIPIRTKRTLQLFNSLCANS